MSKPLSDFRADVIILIEDAYEAGKEFGYDEGYEDGYNTGYVDGQGENK